ncbi:9809_t:CDS:1, partial [Racocetra fulgida]
MDEIRANESSSIVPLEFAANNRSFVWHYFKKNGHYAKCDICGRSLTYVDGLTSNLRKHLKLHIHIDKVPELISELTKNQQ